MPHEYRRAYLWDVNRKNGLSLASRRPGWNKMQAMKDQDGREIVESLVEDYRRTLESNFPATIRPDINVLRRILKLDK